VKLLLVKAKLSSRECVVTLAGGGIFEVLNGVTSFKCGPQYASFWWYGVGHD